MVLFKKFYFQKKHFEKIFYRNKRATLPPQTATEGRGEARPAAPGSTRTTAHCLGCAVTPFEKKQQKMVLKFDKTKEK
jgi:hypothetical protein